MATQTIFPVTDLVLRVSGGQRDGELIPVKTQKCFLGIQANSRRNTQGPRCAIFRGAHGAVVRIEKNEITVNGVGATVHWLKQGDQIEFPNSLTFEVTQLGTDHHHCDDPASVLELSVDNESGQIESIQESPEPRSLESIQTIELEKHETIVDRLQFDATAMVEEQDSLTEDKSNEWAAEESITEFQVEELRTIELPERELSSCKPTAVAPDCEAHLESPRELNSCSSTDPDKTDAWLAWLETQIRDIQGHNCLTESNFEKLNQKLDDLSCQISEMVSIAGDGQLPSVELKPHVHSPYVNDGKSAETFIHHAEHPEESILDTTNADDGAESENRITDDHKSIGDSNPYGGYDLAGDSYSYAQDDSDDERIVTFDSDETESDETIESADHVEITTEPSEPPDHPTVDRWVEPDSPASQLLRDFESNVQAAHEETPAEPTRPPLPIEPENGPRPNESVADLLARMKSEGQWSSAPDGDDEGNQPIDPEGFQTEPATEQPENVGRSVDDVNDYMSELLSRMHGDAAPSQPETVAEPQELEPTEPSEDDVISPPVNPLKEEDFVPNRRATKIDSFDAMRELANSSARSAVMKSQAGRRQALGYLQIGIAASFLMSVYYLVVSSKELFDTGFLIGLACLTLSGILGYRFYVTTRHDESQKSSVAETKPAKPADNPAVQTETTP